MSILIIICTKHTLKMLLFDIHESTIIIIAACSKYHYINSNRSQNAIQNAVIIVHVMDSMHKL